MPTRRPDLLDIAVATALALYGLTMFTADLRPPDAVDVTLLSVTCVAMVWRRQAPELLLAWCAGIRLLTSVTERGTAYPTWAISIALFTFAAARPVWASVSAWFAVLVLYLLTPYQAGMFEALSLAEIVSPAGFFAAALGGGFVVKRQHQLYRELQVATAEVAASVAAREQIAVMDERNRLRDDLHDIVGHHINVASVLADTARAAHGHDEHRLLSSLDTIGSACRSALDEMDRATAWLATADVEPTPSLGERGALLESVRAAGLDVDEHTAVGADQLDRLDQVISATAHRFLREALTNVLKHSPQRHCAVHLTIDASTLAVAVASTLPDAVGTGSSGTGLHRLRRRVELLGGTLDAGPVEGRFVQRATFVLRRKQ